MKTQHIALRGLLWFICVYHVACGLAAMIWPQQIPAIAATLAGMKINPVPEFVYLAKPFGVYAAVFGVMMGVAAWNPVKNRALITIGVVLFGLRILQRVLALNEVEQLFGVSHARSVQTIVIVAALGAALAWFRFRLYVEMRDGRTAPSS